MPELNEKVWADLHQLQRLSAAFVMTQKELESDEFGTGSPGGGSVRRRSTEAPSTRTEDDPPHRSPHVTEQRSVLIGALPARTSHGSAL
jgi:hypothetical protein